MCEKLQEERKILPGGPASGAVMRVLIVSAGSVQGLNDVITSLPLWSRMETEVTPLTSFEGRKLTLRSRLEQLKAQVRNLAERSAAWRHAFTACLIDFVSQNRTVLSPF